MHRRRPSSGFSLLELMVTMAIATVLLGMGAGVYLKLGRQSAATQGIRSVTMRLAQARTASARYPATIVADPEQNVLHAYTDEVLQELRFEPRPLESGSYVPRGIEGRECTIVGGTLVENEGRVGGGLRLDGGSVDCSSYAAFDVDQGINAELWIRPTQPPRCDLVTRGPVLRVQLAGGPAGARLTTRIKVQSTTGSQENVERSIEIPPVRLGEWLGIRISYDRTELVTQTNDGYGWIDRDRWKEEQRRTLAKAEDAPLVLAAGLHGFLDDVRIGGIRSSEPLQLPAEVTFAGQNPPVRFLQGRLDPAFHPGPARLSVRSQGRVFTFDIAQSGAVMRIVESDAPPTAANAVPEARATPIEKKE